MVSAWRYCVHLLVCLVMSTRCLRQFLSPSAWIPPSRAWDEMLRKNGIKRAEDSYPKDEKRGKLRGLALTETGKPPAGMHKTGPC